MSRSQFEWLIGGPSDGASGTYEAPFLSGSVQVIGPDGTFAGFGDFQFGFALPNASGIPSEGMLLGGAGKTQVVYITDEQIGGQKGITVIREAGDANAVPGNDDGGDLLDFAGGTLSGNGGTAKYQGGTSVHGRAGNSVLHGGNTTDGIPGDAVCIGGETGPVGANVLLIATKPPGAPSAGDVRIQTNSNVLVQFLEHGEIYLTSSGTGAGLAGQPLVSGGFGAPARYQVGFTGTVVTFGPHTNGSQTFASGLLISQVQAT